MSLSVMATTTTELVLKPAIKSKLLRELRIYADAKVALKEAEAKVEKHKGVIAVIREEIGEQTIAVDGYSITLVAGVKSTLKVEKLIALGVSTAMIEAATIISPIKSYTKITMPKDSDA